jgi:hypothetical protein
MCRVGPLDVFISRHVSHLYNNVDYTTTHINEYSPCLKILNSTKRGI